MINVLHEKIDKIELKRYSSTSAKNILKTSAAVLKMPGAR